MAKLSEHDKTHMRNLAAIRKRMDRIFAEAAKEAARIGVKVKEPLPEERIFSFDDYPGTLREVTQLVEDLRERMEVAIANGVRSAWTLSNDKNNALVSRIFAGRESDLSDEEYRQYFSNNNAALEAFLRRRSQGMDLSDRVWNYSQSFRREIEMGIDLGLRSGESAAQMARSLRQYLRQPDKLFRRVRDRHGVLQLSKAAKAYKPGRGVYRSSYKNALRLAATETNMAYRTADHLRWQQLDFVVGIEIRLSNNHTLNGARFTDICDRLAGRYPKDFKFTGWHPQCRCHAVTVLKTEEEMAEDTRRILAGEAPRAGSENTVADVPEAFRDWVKENEERISAARQRGTLPYFLRDNGGYLSEGRGSGGNDEIKNKRHLMEDRINGNYKYQEPQFRVPPKVEEYIQFNDSKIMVSPLHGKNELESNLKLAQILYNAFRDTVYLLPNINPNGPEAYLRKEYIPIGVKEGKNADFMCANRIWDGKEASFAKSDRSRKSVKSILENHIKKAKQQADNMIIQIPEWVNEEWVEQIVTNHLSLSSADRWIIISKENGDWKLYK